jgi:hypothetical protein
MGTSITANQNKANIGLGTSYGIIYNALHQAPDVSVYNADGSFSGPAEVNGIIQGGQNPVQQALMVSITNYLIHSNIQGRVYGDIKFDKGFTLHSEVNGRFNWGQAKIFRVFVENSIYKWIVYIYPIPIYPSKTFIVAIGDMIVRILFGR